MIATWVVLALSTPPEAGLELTWAAPPTCPSEQEVRARVVALVGPEAVRRVRLSARASVREESGGWALDLDLSGETGGGRRALRAERGGALAGAAAVVIAIAIDPGAALQQRSPLAGVVPEPPAGVVPEPPAGVVPEPLPTAEVPRPAPAEGAAEVVPPRVVPLVEEERKDMSPDERRAPAEAPRVRVGIRAAGGVSFARLLPGPSGAVGLTLSAAGRGWRVELGGLYAPPVPGGTAQIGGVFQSGAVEMRGCPALSRRAIEVPICLGLQVGAMVGRGRGTGLETTTSARALWLAGTLGAALVWRPWERVGFSLQVDALVGLTRPVFQTAGGEVVHRASRFGGQALVGVEVRVR